MYRPADTSSRCAADFSLNWVIRFSSPYAVTLDSSQQSSVCSLDVALAEEDAALGIEPRGQQDRGGVVDGLAQRGRLVGDRDRVQVDDAVDRLAAVLAGDVLGDRADVVAEVLATGRLDAGEDPHFVEATGRRYEESARASGSLSVLFPAGSRGRASSHAATTPPIAPHTCPCQEMP